MSKKSVTPAEWKPAGELTWEDCLPHHDSILSRVVNYYAETSTSMSPLFVLGALYPCLAHCYATAGAELQVPADLPFSFALPKVWTFMLGGANTGKSQSGNTVFELYAQVVSRIFNEEDPFHPAKAPDSLTQALRPDASATAVAHGEGRLPLCRAAGTYQGVTHALSNRKADKGLVYWNPHIGRTQAICYAWEVAQFFQGATPEVFCEYFDQRGVRSQVGAVSSGPLTKKDLLEDTVSVLENLLMQGIYATTPESWKGTMSATILGGGLYSRMVFFVDHTIRLRAPHAYDDTTPDVRRERERQQAARLAHVVDDWADSFISLAHGFGGRAKQVTHSPEARKVITAYIQHVDRQRLLCTEDDRLGGQWGRTIQHVFTVAGLNALSRKSSTVDRQDAEAAVSVMRMSMQLFEQESDKVVASQFETWMIRVVRILDGAGASGLPISQVKQRMGRVPNRQADEVLATLVARGEIVHVTKGRFNRCYHVKHTPGAAGPVHQEE